MKLNSLQNDRAAGVLVAQAVGDALGAGYEFGPSLSDDVEVTMTGGGPFGFAPAEWTDDTSMAIVIAESMLDAVTDGRVPVDDMSMSAMVSGWIDWAADSKDVGIQTSSVLSRVRPMLSERPELVECEAAYAAAEQVHRRSGRSGGNGSLMRTAPLALAFLDDPTGLWEAAYDVSGLTHFEVEAREACALWCTAIRHAVLTGESDVRTGLAQLDDERAQVWTQRIDEAETSLPRDFTKNGWVVQAFQGAWSAIATTADAGSGPAHLRAALKAAVCGGNDTDTVAAIAGGLLGAAYGYTAVPFEWRRRLHGWPKYRAGDLMRMGLQLAEGEGRTPGYWPDLERFDNSGFISNSRTEVVEHPLDSGVLLGGAPALQRTDYDAVVSLSRVGTAETHVSAEDHASFWLLDEASPASNAHLEFVLNEAAYAVDTFRTEGKRVLLHCVRMESRTPTVAALYGARISRMTPSEALEKVRSVLPGASPNRRFMQVLENRRTDESASSNAITHQGIGDGLPQRSGASSNEENHSWTRLESALAGTLSSMPWNDFLRLEYAQAGEGNGDRAYAQANTGPDGVWCEVVSERYIPRDEWPIDTEFFTREGWSRPSEDAPNWTKFGVPLHAAAAELLNGLRYGRHCKDAGQFMWHVGSFPSGPGPNGGETEAELIQLKDGWFRLRNVS